MGVTAGSPNYVTTRPARKESGLDAILGERARLLGELVAEVRTQRQERDQLSRRVTRHIWEEYLERRAELLPLRAVPLRFDRSLDARRASLDDRLDRLRVQARQEAIDRWRDVAVLRREEREWVRQHRDLVERLSLLGGARSSSETRTGRGRDL